MPPAPVRRVLSLFIAGFSVLLTFGLVIASQATLMVFGAVLLGTQLLFVLAWTVASRPPAPWVVAAVGGLTSIAAVIAVNRPVDVSLTPLAYVVAGALIAAVIGQLTVRGGHAGVTESLSVTMAVVVGVVAFSAYLVLGRQPLGDQVLIAGLISAGVGLAAARICDVFAVSPRITPQVPRGAIGVVAGAMVGTAAGAYAGYLIDGLSTSAGAGAGMVSVLVALVVDLGTGYAEAGRRLEGEAPAMWLARHMQGPLGAFAFAAPACYVMGVILR